MGESRPSSGRRAAAHSGRLLLGQLGYGHRVFWRTPLLAFVTIGFPLVFLFMLGVGSRDMPDDPTTGAPAIQTVTPIAVVFAAVMAAFVMLPFVISQARERGVLKRLSGSPLPMVAYLAGRAGTAATVAVGGAALVVLNAVTAFGLELSWAQVPAMVTTFVIGVACFAALGFAAAMVLRTSTAVMAFTMGSFLLVAFASGTFAAALALPRPLEVGSWLLPLRHFSVALGETFDPTTTGMSLAWSHLSALVAWGTLGGLIARRRWSAEVPRTQTGRHRSRTDSGAAGRFFVDASFVRDGARRGPHGPRRTRHGRSVAMWRGQVRTATRQMLRDPASAFFAVAFPVLFVLVVPYAFGRPVIDGVPFAAIVTPAMGIFAAAVTAYVNMPEAVAVARDRGVLKRLRGTPLPASAYVAGRLGSVLWIVAWAVTAVFTTGWLVHGVGVDVRAWPALTGVFILGTSAFACLGLMVVALVSDPKAVPAVSLGTFLPLAFVSDLLAFGIELPTALSTIGWLFPLRHLVEAVHVTVAGGGPAWGSLAVVAAWGMIGALVAVWRFRWEPHDRATAARSGGVTRKGRRADPGRAHRSPADPARARHAARR